MRHGRILAVVWEGHTPAGHDGQKLYDRRKIKKDRDRHDGA